MALNKFGKYIIHDLLLVELFDFKYYRDLEMWVTGHSRSLKMAPFDGPYATDRVKKNYDNILSRFHLIPERQASKHLYLPN